MLYHEILGAFDPEAAASGDSDGLVGYLRGLARRILSQLDLPDAPPLVDGMAAVSALVRACPPGAPVVLEGDPALTDLAAATVDIAAARPVILAERTGPGAWRTVAADPTWLTRIRDAASALDLPCALSPPVHPPPPLGQAMALVTRRPSDPGDYTRAMPGAAYVLALDQGAAAWPGEPFCLRAGRLAGIDLLQTGRGGVGAAAHRA